MTGWQPISTAPKDRRVRLWIPPCQTFRDGIETHGRYVEAKPGVLKVGYWTVDVLTYRNRAAKPFAPSHWMDCSPAPEAPQTADMVACVNTPPNCGHVPGQEVRTVPASQCRCEMAFREARKVAGP